MNGYNLEKGTEIRLINYLPHVSSDHYEDPRTFNPDRFLKNLDDQIDEETNEKAGKPWFQPFGKFYSLC